MLPQTLYHLRRPSADATVATVQADIDFSSLFVYTCTASCSLPSGGAVAGSGADDSEARVADAATVSASAAWSGGYCEEFIWVQVDTAVAAGPEPTEAVEESKSTSE